jgi:ribose 5-phosphate isomerase B
MNDRAIAIASDHAGFALKSLLKADLEALGLAVIDLGTDNEEPVDYPDFAAVLMRYIESGKVERGVLICGSGVGMSMAANRHSQARAALCRDAETARLSRLHNDANVLVLGGRVTPRAVARECLRAFLDTAFEGGRHRRRIAKIA